MVVSSAYLMMMLLSCVEAQSNVYSEKSLGLRQQPCGVPVPTVSSAETFFLSVRKSRIQLWVGVGTPRSASLAVSLVGLI